MKLTVLHLKQVVNFLEKHQIEAVDLINSFDGLHLKFKGADGRGHYDIKLTEKGPKISQYTREEDL